METIKFSTRSFWFKYWQIITFFPNSWIRPSDTCALRRDLIFFTLLALFTLPIFAIVHGLRFLGYTLKEVCTGKECYVLMTLLQSGLLLMAVVMMGDLGVSFTLSYIILLFGGALSFIALILCLILIGALINWAMNKIKFKSNPKPSIIRTLYNGAKDKLCSRIEYVD